MLNNKGRLVLFFLLLLATGSVIAMSGLFKTTMQFLSKTIPKERTKIKLIQYTYTSFNITHYTNAIKVINNTMTIDNSYPINIYSRVVVINATFPVNPYIHVFLKSYVDYGSSDLGRDVVLTIAYEKDRNNCLTLGELIKKIFGFSTEIKTNKSKYLCITNFKICKKEDILCEVNDNSNYTKNYVKYYIIVIFGPGNIKRKYKLGVDVGFE